MKKFFFGLFLCVFLLVSVKMDSFASELVDYNFNVHFGFTRSGHTYRSLWLCTAHDLADNYFAVLRREDGNFIYYYIVGRSVITSQSSYMNSLEQSFYDGNMTSQLSNSRSGSNSSVINLTVFGDFACMVTDSDVFISASIPIFNNRDDVLNYFDTGDTSSAENVSDLPFSSTVASDSIPTPVVNWALNSDGSLSRTLQFTNAQLPANPNIRMGLQLIVHWASIDNISMSYSNQSAGMLSTGYSVFYDNALSQDGVSLGYPLPESVSDMKPCPSEINFITNTDSIALFNSFLTSHPVSERTITYSPSGISSFAESFRSHLGDIDFAYNVPYVSCRYYYKSADGSSLNYGGWTNTYPKLPAQGAVLSINKQNGQIIVPVNDGTVNQGFDINDNPIFDNSTVIESPELVNFDDLNNSVHNLFSYLGEFPSFLAYLFPFLPSWIPILLASVIGTLIVIGVVRIVLK